MKNLAVFDFDNTLVMSKSKVKITRAGRSTFLDPHAYAHYMRRPADVVDYSQFNQVVDPILIKRYLAFFKAALKSSHTDVVILTARKAERPIAEYLVSIGITSSVRIKGLNSSSPEAKRLYIKNRILKHGPYANVVFYDDSPSNVRAVEALRLDPQITSMIHPHLVPPSQYGR